MLLVAGLVQTFSFEDAPDGVSLETMTFDLTGNGPYRLVAASARS